MPRNSTAWYLGLLTLLWAAVACDAFLHGQPEPGADNRYRSQSATDVLNRLWGAAKERADEARANRVKAEKAGTKYIPSNTDLFAGLMDYAKDKLDSPPLLRVEENLVLIHKALGSIALEVAKLVELNALDAVIGGHMTPELQETISRLRDIANSTLRPVQGKKYTIIGKGN